jgi:DHA2 family multidrug resistance protein
MPPLSSNAAPNANKWIIAGVVMFGAFMAVMDISVVNVALPHMMGTFGESLSAITWVATSYSIAEIIMVSMAGWFSTLLGRKRLYLLSFALFTVGSILCGTAHTFTQMMIYRTIQGIGGGSLIPVSQAILREAFPHEQQGIAMAIYGMGVVLAPATGPIIGGWLTDHYGWPAIFYINVPVSIIGIILTAIFLYDPPYLRRGVKSIDWGGIGLLAVSLTGLQIVMERGQEKGWFSSSLIVWGTIITLSAIIALIIWELRADHPIINLRLLKHSSLSIGCCMGIVLSIGLFGTTFILPQFTQDLLGYDAFKSGLILAPRAFALLAAMPLAGILYRHVNAKALILFGLGFILWSYWDLAHLSLTIDFWGLVPLLLIMGIGMPFMFVTISTVSLSAINRQEMTDASSIYTLARRVGGNIGYALVATLVARGVQVHRTDLTAHVSAYNPAYRSFLASATALLQHQGLSALQAGQAALGLINQLVNRQATMMAYNGAAYALGFLFLATVPLVFLLPRGSKLRTDPSAGGH